MKRLLIVIPIVALTGCGAAQTKATGVPYSIGSTRSSTPSGIAAIGSLATAQKDCYAAQVKPESIAMADVAKLSAAGQAAYFRKQETEAVVKAVR